MFLLSHVGHRSSRKVTREEDRRKYVRVTSYQLLKYKPVDRDKELSFTRNVSEGGVLFYCKEWLAVGSIVEMEINFLDFPHPIKVVAKIVRVSLLEKNGGYDIGAEFISVEDSVRDFIQYKIGQGEE